MLRFFRLVLVVWAIISCFTREASAQNTFTWQQIRERFEASNPTLRAGQLGIEQSHAQEVSAFLRPNANLGVSVDQVDPFTTNPYRPLSNSLPLVSLDY